MMGHRSPADPELQMSGPDERHERGRDDGRAEQDQRRHQVRVLGDHERAQHREEQRDADDQDHQPRPPQRDSHRQIVKQARRPINTDSAEGETAVSPASGPAGATGAPRTRRARPARRPRPAAPCRRAARAVSASPGSSGRGSWASPQPGDQRVLRVQLQGPLDLRRLLAHRPVHLLQRRASGRRGRRPGTAAESVSRCESRTSLTSSASVGGHPGRAGRRSPAWCRRRRRRRRGRPRPWRSRRATCPRTTGTASTHTSSTGSVSSSTS